MVILPQPLSRIVLIADAGGDSHWRQSGEGSARRSFNQATTIAKRLGLRSVRRNLSLIDENTQSACWMIVPPDKILWFTLIAGVNDPVTCHRAPGMKTTWMARCNVFGTNDDGQ